jgi:predicted dehydrogenase
MPVSRRSFSKLGAMGLGAQWIPRGLVQAAATTQTGQRRVGYAVIGLGRIATHFLEGTQMSAQSKITALVSGHRDKAERIAAQYGVPPDSIYSYEDFDRIAANHAVDAVYVALPNSMHAEYTIRAAKAGKHVLCEKPMEISSARCVQMIDACKAARVKLMIAYRLHYEPTHLKALEIVRSGKLGRVQSMDANHGSNMRAGEWRLTKALGGGGPMFDHGVYSLNIFRWFTGEEPAAFGGMISTPDQDERFKEVEENVQWVQRFPSGALASGAGSYGVELGGYWRLHGPWGWLQMSSLTYQGQHLFGHYASAPEVGAPWIEVDVALGEKDPMQFAHQVDHFSECILHDRVPNTPGEEGLADLRALEGVYKSAGVAL